MYCFDRNKKINLKNQSIRGEKNGGAQNSTGSGIMTFRNGCINQGFLSLKYTQTWHILKADFYLWCSYSIWLKRAESEPTVKLHGHKSSACKKEGISTHCLKAKLIVSGSSELSATGGI